LLKTPIAPLVCVFCYMARIKINVSVAFLTFYDFGVLGLRVKFYLFNVIVRPINLFMYFLRLLCLKHLFI